MRRLLLFGSVLVLLACLGVFLALRDLERYARTPAGGEGEPRTVQIAAGKRFAQVAAELHEAGLIRSPLRFKLLARRLGSDKRVQAGEYELRASLTPAEVLNLLEKGAVKQHRLTVPEGLSVAQIADLASRMGFFSREAFLAQAHDPSFLRAVGVSAASPEGYLFPDTYFFPRGTAPPSVIAAMVSRFRAVFEPEWELRAAALGLTVHEAVTLASIIEKETAEPAERPLISSVFHNRLRRGMRLETDPTVIYGIPDFDGNLTRRHLETPSPYNTYLIKGLPPGPIASPGREAIRAALYPAQTDYLFFVSRNDGTHHFSASLSEHSRAVRQYQPAAPEPGEKSRSSGAGRSSRISEAPGR
jgi:UPF0755 protein